jgi:ribose transport system ATP-binding protein
VVTQVSTALSVRGLSKTFVGQRALVDVDLDVAPGEIRALVGENGCGKSTLIKILAGFHEPDAGAAVSVAGEPLALGQPGAGEAAGLRFVHQDLGLVAGLDGVDNLALGRGYRARRAGLIDWAGERRAAQAALRRLGYEIDLRTPVGRLTISERTAVAVARALRGSVGGKPAQAQRDGDPGAATMLVLDEPTANLPAAEAARLFALVRSVRDSGVSVLFVSHHFDEVFALADTVTVLRDGRVVATRPVAGLTEPELVELVIGRPLELHEDLGLRSARADTVLSASGLRGQVVAGVDLDLHAGEVLGVAGITGSGREELAGMLFGGLPRTGTVSVAGDVVPPRRPDRAIAAGMGLVPAERHANAAFLAASLRENVTLVDVRRNVVAGLLRHRRERSDVAHWLERLQVRPARSETAMAALSGGNQQKVVLARWLRQEPRVLVLDDPTQGVDVGAKAEIHGLIDEAAANGTAVLVLSSDHEELARLCHRVLVLRSGVVADELRPPALTAERLTAGTIGTLQAT